MSMASDEMKGHTSSELKRRLADRAVSSSWDWCSFGAVAGLGGGLISILVGSLLTAISWLTGRDSYIQAAGTVLLILTIPLLVIGAQCLDLMEQKQKERDPPFHENKE